LAGIGCKEEIQSEKDFVVKVIGGKTEIFSLINPIYEQEGHLEKE